jgi:hypothetical protein
VSKAEVEVGSRRLLGRLCKKGSNGDLSVFDRIIPSK